jgi:hypothetical protein
MNVTISATVGYKSANRPSDVQKIHDLLKRIPTDKGGPPPSFDPQVAYSPSVTDVHILNFQVRHFGKGPHADAVVTPARETLARMNELGVAADPGGGTPKWPKSQPPGTVGEIVQWFVQDILPLRTTGSGDPSLIHRAGRVIGHLSGEPSDPNGICGSAANFVYEQYMGLGGKGLTVGYILWKQEPFFTHVANVIMPIAGVMIYDGAEHEGVLELGTVKLPFSMVQHWTVMDLYFKRVSTVEQWWSKVSYLGWGRLTLDPDGVFINT